MKRIILIHIFLWSLLPLAAAEIDVEKPADAFATWTDIIVRKDFDVVYLTLYIRL